jgi:hypothetical protein
VPGGGYSTASVEGDHMAILSSRAEVGLSIFKLSTTAAEKIGKAEMTDRGASPIVHNGYVYAVGRSGATRAVCVDINTGAVKWDEKLPVSSELSSPIFADGKIIAVVGSEIFLISASPEKYSLLGRANLNIMANTSPALADGKLYLRVNDGIACYDLAKK